ncbi:MAG TPA: hypothetical protein VFT32_01295 [Candidatus Eisenbacteria bacterium]|nr:hypothetical protein [Candidatus Eisenbacteria bacterium]
MKRLWIAAAIALMAASSATAQPASPGTAAQQVIRQARMQEMNAQMARVQNQLMQLNQRLLPMPVHQGFKDLGGNMAQVWERLRVMETHREQLQAEPVIAGDCERLRAMERVQDRLRVMNREMTEAFDALSVVVAMPARPGSPPDAAEQMVRAQRQQETEQVINRTNERLKALDAWSKEDRVLAPAKELTKDVLLLRDRLTQMKKACDRIAEDPAMEPDRDRLREVNHVRHRLEAMFRETEEFCEALESAVTPATT